MNDSQSQISNLYLAQQILTKEPAWTKLANDEQQKIANICTEVMQYDCNAILNFGITIQKCVSEFTDQIMMQIRNKNANLTGSLLKDLLADVLAVAINKLQPPRNSFWSKLFGTDWRQTRRLLLAYNEIGDNVVQSSLQLLNTIKNLQTDIENLENLFQSNLENLHHLNLYIVAGKLQMERYLQGGPVVWQQERPIDQFNKDFDYVANYKKFIKSFAERIYNLELTRSIYLQIIPQIRLVKKANKNLIDVVTAIYQDGLPKWQTQIAIALQLYRQRIPQKIMRELHENTMILLDASPAKIACTNENNTKTLRGLVDIDNLYAVNTQFINLIENALHMHLNSKLRRAEAAKELVHIENLLKKTLFLIKKQDKSRSCNEYCR